MKQKCKLPQKDIELYLIFENYAIIFNILCTTPYIKLRERKVQQYWFDSFGKRNTHLSAFLNKDERRLEYVTYTESGRKG